MAELLLYDKGKVYNLINSVGDISYSTSMYDQAGKLSFTLFYNEMFPEGSRIEFIYNGDNVFSGFLFSQQANGTNVDITAYDQTRYLKNKDTLAFNNMTADEIFLEICKRYKLKCKVVNPTGYKLPIKLYKNKTLWEMIKGGIESTLQATGKLYFVRDNFGVLEFIDVRSQRTNLLVNEKSLLIDYKYKRSIDNDTYNRVKITRDNKETVKRDVWIAEDSQTQANWGILQYYQEINEKVNEAQIKALAETILKLKNRVEKSVEIKSLGSPTIKAGSGFKLEINNVANFWMFCESVDLTFSENKITMKTKAVI